MPIPAIQPYPMPSGAQIPASAVRWRPDAARAVLLVHDMQRYFLAPFPAARSPLVELLANVRRLRDAATRFGVPVVYTAQPGGMTRPERGLLHDFWGPGMNRAEADREIVPEVAPTERDTVLTKWRYSAFLWTGLADLLAERGRDQLIICGVYANTGCLMSACDAFSMDIEAFLVPDAVADFSSKDHHLALNYAASRCAVPLPSTATVAALENSARTATDSTDSPQWSEIACAHDR